MKKILTFLLLGIFMLSLTSSLECWATLTQDTQIELIQKCPSCSYSNLTSISYPNGTILLNEEMQKTGINFNYTLPDSSQSGRISYGVIGDKNGVSPPLEETLCIEITPTGSDFTIQQGILYGFILILLAAFLYLALYGIRNAVSAEWLIGYICLSYIVLYLILSVIWILSMNYLWSFPMLESVLFMAWLIMGVGLLPFIFVISLYILGKEAKASLEENYVKQGYSREEARELSKKNKR